MFISSEDVVLSVFVFHPGLLVKLGWSVSVLIGVKRDGWVGFLLGKAFGTE